MLTMMPAGSKRPYWHVDAKWVCALLALPLLSLWLLGFGLYRLTDASRVSATASAVIQSVFTNPSSETKLDINKLQQQLEPLYLGGPEGVARRLTSDRSEQSKISKQLEAFRIFTKQSHDRLGLILVFGAVATLLLLGGVVYFGAGAGRLVSTGLIFVIASLSGTLAAGTLQTGNNIDGVRIATLGPQALRLFGSSLFPAYATALAIGIVLLLVAVVVKLRRQNPA